MVVGSQAMEQRREERTEGRLGLKNTVYCMLDWIRLDWIGSDWIRSDLIGLDREGWEWIGEDGIGLDRMRMTEYSIRVDETQMMI